MSYKIKIIALAIFTALTLSACSTSLSKDAAAMIEEDYQEVNAFVKEINKLSATTVEIDPAYQATIAIKEFNGSASYDGRIFTASNGGKYVIVFIKDTAGALVPGGNQTL
jgi:outer membrane lipoprotein-sorting protein